MSLSTENIQLTKTTTILDLNDHVLCEVFKNMDDFDLSAIANVCSNFRMISESVFGLRYKQKIFSTWLSQRNIIFPMQFGQFRSILRSFGPLINSFDLKLHGDEKHTQQIMEFVVRYCGETLDELRLVYAIFTAELTGIMAPLLRRVRKIKLSDCMFDAEFDAAAMFFLCSQLETLSFVRIVDRKWMDSDVPICVTIPKLKSLSYWACCGIENKSFEKFLKKNPQLTDLKVLYCTRMTNQIYNSVARYTPQVNLTFSNC